VNIKNGDTSTSINNTSISEPGGSASHIGNIGHSTVVLGPALAQTRDRFGRIVNIRILVDSGSQLCAITESCVHCLGLPIKKWTLTVSGLSTVNVPKIQGLTSCVIHPRFDENLKIEVNAWVLPKITVNLPSCPLPASVKRRFSHIALADPAFDVPASIDLLLGADLYHHIFDGKQYSDGDDGLTAYSSIFGWILIGPVQSAQSCVSQVSATSLVTSLEEMLVKFWEIDEPEIASCNDTEDGLCEKLFLENSY